MTVSLQVPPFRQGADVQYSGAERKNERKGNCERFEPRSHFKRLSLIVRVNVVLNKTVVVDSD